MKKTWKEHCKVLSEFNTIFSPQKDEIEDEYEKKIKELKLEKEKKISRLKKRVLKKVNPQEYDLDISMYIVSSEVGFEIGDEVVAKRKKTDLEPISKSLKVNCYNFDEEYVFRLDVINQREGFSEFVCVSHNHTNMLPSIFPPDFAICFDVVSVVKEKTK